MSAFFVADATIHDAVRLFLLHRQITTNADTPTELGRELLQMNRSAMLARYPDLFGTDYDDDMANAARDYRYQSEEASSCRGQLAKSANCLAYQCCEGDIPESRELYRALDTLCKIVGEPEGYDEAQWGRE